MKSNAINFGQCQIGGYRVAKSASDLESIICKPVDNTIDNVTLQSNRIELSPQNRKATGTAQSNCLESTTGISEKRIDSV